MTLFVTFEGPEGAGKTTQARRVSSRLRALGHHVVVTREPGGTPIGEALRSLLLDPQYSAMLPETETLLNTAARAQHVADVIAPALAAGRVVICDRFLDSTLAYQGAGRGLDLGLLREFQRFATRGVWPDMTLLFDLPVREGLARRRRSGDELSRFDDDSEAFHERVLEYFRQAASREPARWRVVDASRPEAEVEQQILSHILARLEPATVRHEEHEGRGR